MKIFILDGIGYISSHAIKELIKNDAKVFVINNLSTGYRILNRG